MIKTFENFLKLNETPDLLNFNGKKLTTYDNDAVSFCVLTEKSEDGKFIVYVDHIKGAAHGDSEYKQIDENDPPDNLTTKYPYYYREFYGRLWLNSKVISFWSVPTKPRTTGKSIIDIENYVSTDHDEYLSDKLENDLDLFRYYMKELKEKLVKRGFIDNSENLDEWYIEKHNDFIKVKDFTGGFKRNEDEYRYHLMEPTDFRRKNRPKFGKKMAIKWKQALMKSENYVFGELSDDDFYYEEGEIIEYKVKAWSTSNNRQVEFTKLGEIDIHQVNNSGVIYRVKEFPTKTNNNDFGTYVKDEEIIRVLPEEEVLIYIDSKKYNL